MADRGMMTGARPTALQQQPQIDSTAEAVKARFLQFLYGFGEEMEGVKSYSHQAEVMRNTETSSLFVDFMHVQQYDEDLANAIIAQYYRWEPYLRKAVFEFIRNEDEHYTINDDALKTEKEFFVCFYNIAHVSSIRDLRTNCVGRLVSFSGTVTRTSEVRPELMYATFTCNHCGGNTAGVEQQFKYCEPIQCQNPFCTNTQEWELRTEESVFVDWQRIKVQENSDEIPAGSMPRTIDVILRHENVEQAKAGDRVVFTGTLIVVPDVSKFAKLGETVVSSRGERSRNGIDKGMEGQGLRGLKALGVRELTYKINFLACSVQTMEQRFHRISIRSDMNEETDENEFSEEEMEKIFEMREDPQRYAKMARSLCPSVYGHDEIRRGILLMLFGGVHKSTEEGIKLRGDINACIVGDPSTAKSQFLKYICSFLPRAIYTSGKVSSAAGLTASVMRDAESGEYCVEAGALMLADNGICCIDEFDKMESMDQVAIHEAMEQQTISITKAGIQATLNARTSILAAANPFNGRYDRSKTLKYNVNISAPIMSRFDLFFVILDECDEVSDYHIAQHIVNVHKLQEEFVEPAYPQEDLQRYIKYARKFHPAITEESKEVMVDCYRRLRENDVSSNGQSSMAYRITVRQLESMIRLSEALARLDLENTVSPHHVKEAYRLLRKSIIHVDTQEIQLDEVPLRSSDIPSTSSNIPIVIDETSSSSTSKETVPLPPSSSTEIPSPPVETSSSTSSVTPSSKDSKNPMSALSFERFAAMEKAITTFIRQEESDEESGICQGEVVTWYLSQQDISSERELASERQLINSVIQRLIKDGALQVLEVSDDEVDEEKDKENEISEPEIELLDEEMKNSDKDSLITPSKNRSKKDKSKKKKKKKIHVEQRYIAVHPNYACD